MPTNYTIGFALGYAGACLILAVISHLILMPFGYGYIGSELMTAYCVWTTVLNWEVVVDAYNNQMPQ